MTELLTARRANMKVVRKILFAHNIKYLIYENEGEIEVGEMGIVIDDVIKTFKEWFADLDVEVLKSKPEVITILFL